MLCPHGAEVTTEAVIVGKGLIVIEYEADVPVEGHPVPLAVAFAVITPEVTEPTFGAVYPEILPLPDELERSGPPRAVFEFVQVIVPAGLELNVIPVIAPPEQTV